MLIALTGFMGCGKTTVGRGLAEALGCPFVDLDEEIVRKAGRDIPTIFSQDGEAGFRRLEKQALERMVARYAESTAVLSLGGGTVTIPGAVALLQEKTLCIYLRATLETLLARLEGQTAGRPLAAAQDKAQQPAAGPAQQPSPDRERLSALLDARLSLYESAAHVVLDTDPATPDELIDEIIISCL